MNANSSETRVETENNAVAPTTAREALDTVREALDLAWELAHPVKEGQVVSKDTQYLELHISGLRENTAPFDFKIGPALAPITRTLDPLPDPEPDWLDAPAVLAGFGGWDRDEREVFIPTGAPNRWTRANTEWTFHWEELRDVTPLYPKEEQKSVISVHKSCGSQVSTDEKDITPLDGDGENSGYSAACLKCDEDLFPFEIEQVLASEIY